MSKFIPLAVLIAFIALIYHGLVKHVAVIGEATLAQFRICAGLSVAAYLFTLYAIPHVMAWNRDRGYVILFSTTYISELFGYDINKGGKDVHGVKMYDYHLLLLTHQS